MALSNAAQALRSSLLQHFRLPLQQTSIGGVQAPAIALNIWRGFAGGGHLDKDEVTQRVINVTKHFEKIDPAKVGAATGCAAGLQQGRDLSSVMAGDPQRELREGPGA